MNILIDDENKFLDEKPGLLQLIENVVKTTLEQEKFSLDIELSMMITDNNTIREINSKYRGINKVTDVLSFPQIDWNDNNDGILEDINGESEGIMLGDIVISAERAKEQASEYEHSIEREIGFLVAHSMLHLLGYDHMEIEEEKEMMKKQEEILQKLGLIR